MRSKAVIASLSAKKTLSRVTMAARLAAVPAAKV